MPWSLVVAGWVASAAVSDAYQQAAKAARSKTECQKLRLRIQDHTGATFSTKRFEDWYFLDDTWNCLVDHKAEDYEALCSSLKEALWGKRWWFHRTLSADQKASITADVVEVIIATFMQCLEAATAVAVHDHRSDLRTNVVLSAIAGRDRTDERLAEVAPSVRKALESLKERHDDQFSKLLDFVETNKGSPRQALDSVMALPAEWLGGLSGSALLVVAEFANSHNLPVQAVKPTNIGRR